MFLALVAYALVMSKASLFGAAAAGAATGAEKETKKRQMLKNVDTVASKVLDPYGVSIIDDIAYETLWDITKKGDKWAEFFSGFAAGPNTGGVYRQGVAFSQFAQTYQAAIEQMETNDNLKKILAPNVLAKALEEANELKVHFGRLNAGKGSQNTGQSKSDSFGAVKKRAAPETTTPVPTSVELKESATAVHAWLMKGTDSNLRMVINFLGCGGVFYACQCHDKVARAFVKAEKPTEEDFFKMIHSRFAEAGPPAKAARSAKEAATGTLFD